MRTLSAGLAASLTQDTTTLAACWRFTRTDGVVIALTDHDAPLEHGGVSYEPAGAVESGAIESAADLSPDTTSGLGALSSDALTEADLRSGRYDAARIDIFLVDWRAPGEGVHLYSGVFGEVRRRDDAFEVEARGLKAALDRVVGRVYQPGCDADLGDARCRVDLETSAFSSSGAVTDRLGSREFRTDALGAYEDRWFAHGAVAWVTGARAGLVDRVAEHVREPSGARLLLSERPGAEIAAGDGFVISAGCDKRFETCRDKFANVPNFRGFHRMPGDDFIYGYPAAGDRLDGGRR